jgi:hypothetical protein
MGKLTDRQLDQLIAESGIANGARTELGRWISRGDGIAAYRYHGQGPYPRLRFISFGTRWSTIRASYPARQMPSNLGVGGWKDYELVGYYRVG